MSGKTERALYGIDAAVLITLSGAVMYAMSAAARNGYLLEFGLSIVDVGFTFDQALPLSWGPAVMLIPFLFFLFKGTQWVMETETGKWIGKWIATETILLVVAFFTVVGILLMAETAGRNAARSQIAASGGDGRCAVLIGTVPKDVPPHMLLLATSADHLYFAPLDKGVVQRHSVVLHSSEIKAMKLVRCATLEKTA